MKRVISLLLAATLVLSGCANMSNQQMGAIGGGVLGGALGNTMGQGNGRVAMIILGTLAGVAVGSSIGDRMDQVDRMRANQVLESNRTNQASSWYNPDSRTGYTVSPTRTYETPSQVCRDFVMEVRMAGGNRTEQVHGRACRQSDGSWRQVSA